jgi:hypothetical protein
VPVADEVLVRRVADGDTAALAALYSRYRVGLFGFLERYAGDRMLAEEILQDTLLAVWRSAHAYAGRSSVRTWRVLTVGIPQLTGGWLAAAMREVWATSPGTVAATLALLAAAVVLSRHHLRPGGWPGPLRW